MQIKLEALSASLGKPLLPIYLIGGEDPWLTQDATNTIYNAARKQQFQPQASQHIEKDAQWSELAQSGQNGSLFDDKKLYKLTLKKNAISKTGQAVLSQFAKQTNTILLIQCHKFSAADKKAAWFKKVNTFAGIIDIWPLFPNQVPAWIKQRAQYHRLSLSTEATATLSAYCQNNLAAADQALYKLSLIDSENTHTPTSITQALTNQSQYTVFDLLDCLALGHAASLAIILDTLQKEDPAQITLLLYLIMQELEEAHSQNFIGKVYLGKQKIKRLQTLSNQLQPQQLIRFAAYGRSIEKAIKGASSHNPWLLMHALCSSIVCRKDLLSPYASTL